MAGLFRPACHSQKFLLKKQDGLISPKKLREASHMNANSGEKLFYNCSAYTVDAARPRASVIAVSNGRIAYAGDDMRDAKRLVPKAEMADLHGHAVFPGFIDSHQHFLLEGLRLTGLDCVAKSKADIVRAVEEIVKTRKPGEWILGGGWNNALWEDGAWPAKEDLDAAAPNNPVSLSRLDGHSLWVNSLALRAAHIDRNSEDTPGGEIVRSPDGDILGVLVDAAAFKVRAAIPPYTDEQKREACLAAQAELFSLGVTSASDAWIGCREFEFLRSMYESGELHIRLYGMLSSRIGADEARATFPEPVSGLYGNRLSLRAYKVMLDGSLGSRSAWLTGNYADRPGHAGNRRYEDEELLAVLRPAAAKGYQICMHAIGDAAVLQAVAALETLHGERNGESRGKWLAHRIEHFQIASKETAKRAVQIGVIPGMQALHCLADRAMAQMRLPSSLLANSYPWRGILDAGGMIAGGSDSPMDGVNPFRGFYSAVTREAFPCCPGNTVPLRMTREEALTSYTLWAAHAEDAASVKGSLTPGKAADFCVLDRDIMLCPAQDIKDACVLMTVLNGNIVHGRQSLGLP